MSINHQSHSDKTIITSSIRIFRYDTFRLMLNEIYDDLTAQKKRDIWRTASWSILSMGSSGILEWLINDVATQEKFADVHWLCVKSLMYGTLCIVGLGSLLIYSATRDYSIKKSKHGFLNKYVEYSEENTIENLIEVSSTPVDVSKNNGVSLE